MNLQEKLALIEEVLDVETGSLTPETLLAEVGEWDSIAALSLVVMLDEKFEKTVSGAQIKALESVNDILAYMNQGEVNNGKTIYTFRRNQTRCGFRNITTLVTDGFIDSFDIVSIIASIEDEFAVEIPVDSMVAENFESAAAIMNLVNGVKK